MNFIELRDCDIANGEGVRVSLFVSGCRHHCEKCFSPHTWNFGCGEPFTEETERRIFGLVDRWWISGLTILGGDPFEPENAYVLARFVDRFRNRFGDTKTIWLYTGCYVEDFYTRGNPYNTESAQEILLAADVLVDGPYEDALRNPSLAYRGSSNQRIIDLKTMKEIQYDKPSTH